MQLTAARGALVGGVLLAAGFIASTAGAGTASGAAGAASWSRPAAMAPAVPPGADRLSGTLASSTPIFLAVTMRPRDERALEAFILRASTPGSSGYRHYLARGQFARRFGPARSTVRAVLSALQSLGFHRLRLSSDHLYVSVTTTARRVESAFKVDLARYRFDGRNGFLNTEPPLLSGVLASKRVIGILGLDGLVHPRSLLERAGAPRRGATRSPVGPYPPLVKSAGPAACAAAKTASSNFDGYTDTQIADAYKLSSLYEAGHFGAGQTIAVYELEPYLASDLATFQKCYGTSVTVKRVNVAGGPGTGGGSGEAAMDLENLAALAPKAKLIDYQGPASITDSQNLQMYDDMISPDNAKQLTTSWGLCEPDNGRALDESELAVFEEAASYGETFYSASGDDGSTDCLGDNTPNDKGLYVDDPGSDPYVISVGGETLDGLSPAETVWNDSKDGDGAGGGGLSIIWQMPTWQIGRGVVNKYSSRTRCGGTASSLYYCREVPDVSGDANPDRGGWAIYYLGTWLGGNGGTSAAAPLWAAMTADINSGCREGVGFVAPRLYEVAARAGNFTDITVGNNDFAPSGYSGGLFPAARGYDMASGLGGPIASGLASSLC